MKISKQNLPAIEQLFADSDKTDRIIFDEDLPGFGLRLRKGSKRQTYVVQYERQGLQRRLVIGTTAILNPDEARKLAKRELAKVTLGHDPQGDKAEAKARAKITLHAVAQQYLSAKQQRLRTTSYREVERHLRKDWKPLRAFPIHKIERRNVAAVLNDLSKAGPVAAARARSSLSSLFAWAIGEGYLDHNPVTGTNNPDTRVTRDRWLSDAELAAVWNACKDDEYGCIIRLLILTGQRRLEVGGMTWSELDRDNGKWTIPAARTKNGREHTLTLPGMVWQIIERVPRRLWNDRLFGARADKGFTNWNEAKIALDKRAQIAPWVLHDLRRTVATQMGQLGIAHPHIIEAVLNHVSGHKAGVAGIYNRSSYEREVRNALAAWADHIRAITTGSERRIVPIREIPA
ncbi:MAG: tyrosine-type recombinase/integrase [Xanthobacteraceae bacterium]